jgi:hypothetical protein
VLDAIARIQKLIAREKLIPDREFLGFGYQDKGLLGIHKGQQDMIMTPPNSPYGRFQTKNHPTGSKPFTIHNHPGAEPPSEQDFNAGWNPPFPYNKTAEHYQFPSDLKNSPFVESFQQTPKTREWDPKSFERWPRGIDLGMGETIYGEDFDLPDHVIRENLRRLADEDWFNYTVFE